VRWLQGWKWLLGKSIRKKVVIRAKRKVELENEIFKKLIVF
jgi:hypothetical protein